MPLRVEPCSLEGFGVGVPAPVWARGINDGEEVLIGSVGPLPPLGVRNVAAIVDIGGLSRNSVCWDAQKLLFVNIRPRFLSG